MFAADLVVKQQDLLFATQVGASQGILEDKVTAAAWKDKASWYLVSKSDKTIHPDLERFMAKRMHAKTIEIESSHVSLISHSKEIIAVIEEAASTL